MRRRGLLKATLAATLGSELRLALAAPAAQYRGKFVAFVQADGGWDPTSFCDPKTNTPGKPDINNWANEHDIEQEGNIPYAPFAKNTEFFRKHHGKMLVINGVDAQTNSHTVGVMHNWSGHISEGYPTATALFAAHYGGDMPIPYLSFGGFSVTAGVTRFARIPDARQLNKLASPHHANPLPSKWQHWLIPDDIWELQQRHLDVAAEGLAKESQLLPREERHRANYRTSMIKARDLSPLADAFPRDDDEIEEPESSGSTSVVYRSSLRRQAQLAVLAFKTGVSVSADLHLGGFDTHDEHDRDHAWLLGNLTDSIDYLWDYAEEHGIADNLFVVIGSDFGRTNHYNADDGKDHWPIGSYVIMEKDQPWTNRVVGETDASHFAQPINPSTLERDANGKIIYPKHVHKALRRYLGIEDSEHAKRFPFNTEEDFGFFGRSR